jgi:threonine-phosphate decarboxylase
MNATRTQEYIKFSMPGDDHTLMVPGHPHFKRNVNTKTAPEKVVHGGKIRKVLGQTARPVIDFSANLNPAPPVVSPDFSFRHLASYPDDQYITLKEALSGVFGRAVDEIAVGNGSIELIRLFAMAAISAGDRVRIPQPTFGEYEFSARLAGGIPARVGEPSAVTFICNPNNPTGELLPSQKLLAMRREIENEGGILFLDEAFIELADPRESLAGSREPALFVLRSLTKSFAVPGIRFGYAFGDPELIARVEALRPPWSVNAFAEQYALAALIHYGDLEDSRRFIVQEREWLVRRLSPLGIDIHPSSANFLLLTLREDVSGLCASLLTRGILVRDCRSFGLPRSIRVAIRTHDENIQLIEALEECLP